MCYSPISLKEKIDLETGEITGGRNVPCGKCVQCLQNRRNQWIQRLQEEQKVSNSAIFLTLTYDDIHVPLRILNEHYNESYIYLPLVKKDLINYFKRVRHEEKNLRYYAVGEYGTKGDRPHYHCIVFNVDPQILIDKWSDKDGSIGMVTTDPVNEGAIAYVTKYIVNVDGQERPEGYVKPFAIMSKGIGKNYIKYAAQYHKVGGVNHYTSHGGVKCNLARYYRDRIFSNDEKRILDLQAKEIREKEDIKRLESDNYEKLNNCRKAKRIKASINSKSKTL